MPSVLSDVALSRRLEQAEAESGFAFLKARLALDPASGSEWTNIGGAYVMFDGPRSPITQTFGLGLFEPFTEAALDEIEAFFKQRDAPVIHELSPLTDKSVWPALCARGYQPIEFSSNMFLTLSERPAITVSSQVKVRQTEPHEANMWAKLMAEGWRDTVDYADLVEELGKVIAGRNSGACFIAELQNEPIAAGACDTHGGVALMAGACTIPSGRKQGAQLALLDARLRYAEQLGCDLAMINAEAGSGSQRNAERQGFRIAYTRTKWALSTTQSSII